MGKSAPRIISSREEILAFRDELTRNFTVERIDWDDVEQWVRSDFAVSHVSGGFFDLAGIEDVESGDQFLMIHQVQSALTVLVRHVAADDVYLLVQARQEPGNLNGVQFAPTIQSTPANYLAFHGGKSSDYFRTVFRYDPALTLLSDSFQMDLGERYQGKTKRAMIFDSAELLETAPGFAWVPARSLAALAGESGLLNPDLRTLMSVAPWSSDNPRAGFVPASRAVAESLAAPVRSDVIGDLTSRISKGSPRRFRNVPFAGLENWEWTDDALIERRPRQGFEVNFYRVEAPVREVGSWTQPLVRSTSTGRADLAYRITDDVLEMGVRVVDEHGLVAGRGLAPSRLIYPGIAPGDDAPPADPTPGTVSTLESDEGGRFYQDVSRYVTRPMSHDDPADLVWVRISEFKELLRHSTTVSMQLRAQASQLLALEV